jgi:hypothetical protein
MSATVPHIANVTARAGSGAEKRGFFSRLVAFIVEAREREAERKIAQLAARQGGLMTDQFERDIDRFAL